MFRRATVATLALLAGCGGSGEIRCETGSDCTQGGIPGVCRAAPASDSSWCVFPDPSCPSAERWGAAAGDDLATTCREGGAPDAGVPDAGVPDGGTHAFDIVYPDEWEFSVDGPAVGFFVIINESQAPLSPYYLYVQSVSDDHPTATAIVRADPPFADIAPGTASGQLTSVAEQVLSPLIWEPRVDTDHSYLSIVLLDAPDGIYDIHVDLVIGLGGLEVPLPFTIHHKLLPTVYLDPTHGKRVVVTR